MNFEFAENMEHNDQMMLLEFSPISELKVYFRWEKYSRVTKNQEDLSVGNLRIEPAEGSLSPDSTTPFRVIVQTSDLQAGEYRVFIRCEFSAT